MVRRPSQYGFNTAFCSKRFLFAKSSFNGTHTDAWNYCAQFQMVPLTLATKDTSQNQFLKHFVKDRRNTKRACHSALSRLCVLTPSNRDAAAVHGDATTLVKLSLFRSLSHVVVFLQLKLFNRLLLLLPHSAQLLSIKSLCVLLLESLYQELLQFPKFADIHYLGVCLNNLQRCPYQLLASRQQRL
ncbi:hypothetical protein B566_EDAN016143 [Ephemera danica]|nr:hypothetical protein B566_EDAN016143 [Ephemera danica]